MTCPCIICSPYGDLDDLDANTIAHVREHGWSVLEDPSRGYAYTVGLWHSYRSPEVALFGTDFSPLYTRDFAGYTLSGIDMSTVRGRFPALISFYRRPLFPFFELIRASSELTP